MKKCLCFSRLFCVLCLFFAILFIFAAAEANEDEDPIKKYKHLSTNELHREYTASEISLSNAIGNHNAAVAKVTNTRKDIVANNTGIKQTRIDALLILISEGGTKVAAYLTAGSSLAVTIAVSTATSLAPSLKAKWDKKVELWKQGENLEEFLDIASKVAEGHSDIYSEEKHKRDGLRTAYDARFYEDGTPRNTDDPHGRRTPPPTVERELAEIDYPCANACGSRFRSYNNAQNLHKNQCASASDPISGCGKSYYTCIDVNRPTQGSSHEIRACTNLVYSSFSSEARCGTLFRACTNTWCTESVEPMGVYHYSGIGAPPQPTQEAICPRCEKPHSPSGSGSQ